MLCCDQIGANGKWDDADGRENRGMAIGSGEEHSGGRASSLSPTVKSVLHVPLDASRQQREQFWHRATSVSAVLLC